MADLRAGENPGNPARVSVYRGAMVKDPANPALLLVNVNGSPLPAVFADPLTVADGDAVLVQVVSSPLTGQGEAVVLARITSAYRPVTGTVKTVPPSSPTITVTGTDGTDYITEFLTSYTPVVNDRVLLAWNAGFGTVLGKVAVSTAAPVAPPPPPAPPPPAAVTGVSTFAATQSNTFWGPGGWGSWAGGGSHVYQGQFGSGQVFGAWFYSGAGAQLAGRTITRIRFVLGSRRAVGSNNSPVMVHFYAHTSANQPGGDVSRTVGPFDVSAAPGQGMTQYDLPLSFASVLQAGGGIAIALDPYAGFTGRNAQPESGLLRLDWSR